MTRTPRLIVIAAAAFVAAGWVLTVVWGAHAALNVYTVPNAAFFVTGLIVAWQRPAHPIGWLFLVFGPLDVVAGTTLAAAAGASLSAAADVWLVAISAMASTVVTFLIPIVFLLFPDGSLPSARWRPVLWAGAFALLCTATAALLTGGILGFADGPEIPPLGPRGEAVGRVLGYGLMVLPVVLFAGAVGLVVRWRRARGVERQQLKVLLAAASAMLLAAVTMPFTPLSGGGSAGDVIIASCLVMLPVATGVAVLRYRLWEFDVVLSRSVVVVLLAALVTAVYAAVVVGAGRLLQRGTDDLTLQVIATALVAVAFAPARDRAARIANRLVYGRRATPFEVLAEVTDRMGEAVAGTDILDRMAALLAAGTGASTATVWLLRAEELHAAAVWPPERTAPAPVAVAGDDLPALPDAEIVEAVRDDRTLLGALALTTPRGEGVTPAERRLLADMVASAALVLGRLRLDAALAARVEQLRASRRRLVRAQDAARRRLERDLHDGAQQQLVAVKVRLGIARTLARKEGAEALAERLEQLAGETDIAVDELRTVAHGIYPPLLAAEGLPAAFTALARRQPMPVTVHADGVGRHPEDVEASAYFAVAHLLEQAARAGATAAAVDVTDDGAVLNVVVTCDGHEPDVAALVDRIDAGGGTLTVAAERVEVTLPVPAGV